MLCVAERVGCIFGHLCLDEALCKHLPKVIRDLLLEIYLEFSWKKTWKNHENIMEFCQSGNVGTLSKTKHENHMFTALRNLCPVCVKIDQFLMFSKQMHRMTSD